ncbi:MAG: MFS transporter [Ruminococcaceae bacterium]|nr:MFS transporter [Oscillospiraceae bacterium]
MKENSAVKKAVLIGSMCAISYLSVYLARNVLGAVAPQMEELKVIDKTLSGNLSSLFFVAYAIGQLINGLLGDKIKAKYMISFGLLFSGVCNIVFALFAHLPFMAYAAYGMTGFFLSMIYGPMTKTVAENVDPKYAPRCSLGYNFASFFGSPLAGVLAFLFVWQTTFYVSSIVLIVMGICCFLGFLFFEKQGMLQYHKFDKPKNEGSFKQSVEVLLKHKIIKFTVISIVTGVIRITVIYWLTTYISDYLGFSADTAAIIYTVATLVISVAAFVSVFVYERLGCNMNATLLIAFSVAAVSFLLVYFLAQPVLNIIFMVLGVFASNCASSMLWSCYCPSLRDTGMVSGATGFLDFVNYITAAVASSLFAAAVTTIGWGLLILIWFALMTVGVIICLPYKKIRK